MISLKKKTLPILIAVLAVVLVLCIVVCIVLATRENTPDETVPSTVATEPTSASTTEPTTAPTTEPTTAPTTEPPVLYTNPLTGEELDAPYNTRIFTTTINNVPSALPHHGVNDADIFFEMLVNDGATRGLAMFADVSTAGPIGSLRSARYNFVDICEAYNAILAHAGASGHVYSKIDSCGVNNLDDHGAYYYRDTGRMNSGYDWEHCLFTSGENLQAYAESVGYDTTVPEGTEYGLIFTEDGTPDGETANDIYFEFWSNIRNMVYNEETGRYEYWLYGELSTDGNTGEAESFENVLLLQMDVYNDDIYHVADLDGSGEGYYACNGKIVPIQWHHENELEPFTFTLMDGTPLEMGVGNSYIGFVPLEDPITWE